MKIKPPISYEIQKQKIFKYENSSFSKKKNPNKLFCNILKNNFLFSRSANETRTDTCRD